MCRGIVQRNFVNAWVWAMLIFKLYDWLDTYSP